MGTKLVLYSRILTRVDRLRTLELEAQSRGNGVRRRSNKNSGRKICRTKFIT